MADLAYGEVYHMNAQEARFQIVKTYQQTHSIRATARAWRCARQTVRRWVQRFAAEGTGGLADRSRHCPRQTDLVLVDHWASFQEAGPPHLGALSCSPGLHEGR